MKKRIFYEKILQFFLGANFSAPILNLPFLYDFSRKDFSKNLQEKKVRQPSKIVLKETNPFVFFSFVLLKLLRCRRPPQISLTVVI